jgi:hypothetical protein
MLTGTTHRFAFTRQMGEVNPAPNVPPTGFEPVL